jgi:integrase
LADIVRFSVAGSLKPCLLNVDRQARSSPRPWGAEGAAVIERRKTKGGQMRYDVRLRTPDGAERSRTFDSLRDARAYESAELNRRNRGEWIDPRRASTTFGVVAAEWLDSNPAKRGSSWVRDEIALRLQLLPAFGKIPVSRVDKAGIQRWVNERARERAARTVKREYGVLRAVLAFAVDRDLIARTPCRGIKLPAIEPVVRHVITAEALEALADELGPNLGPMAYVGATLGLRWGEVAGLRIGRLDLLRNEIKVVEQVVRGRGGRSTLGPPKSHAGRRTMTMPVWLSEMLAEHLRSRGLTAADADRFLFEWPSGGHLTYSTWRKTWLRAVDRAGLPKGFGFHDLRRANATGLVADGVDVRTAQTRLGHADVRLTLELYAQATTEADRAAAERVGARFAPSGRRRASRAVRDVRGID